MQNLMNGTKNHWKKRREKHFKANKQYLKI